MAKIPKKIISSAIILIITSGCLLAISYNMIISEIEAKSELSTVQNADSALLAMQKNSLLALSSHYTEPKVVKQVRVVVTAYSSTPQQTDDTPFITASGSWVREGIAANNLLPFGTKIKMPEIYGEKVFVIEDRMHSRKGYYHVDVWFPSYIEAVNFGVKKTYIEVLEN